MAENIMEGAALEPPEDDRFVLKWLESLPPPAQGNHSEKILRNLLENASQPRHASGNACIKLCYFVEQCRSSQYSAIQSVVYSEEACLKLFDFYIEWNEKNQNRSMRQVLELTSSLIATNPDKELVAALRTLIIARTIPIITHQGAQPLVKPAFKALECLLNKGTISPNNILDFYTDRTKISSDLETSWDYFISVVFDWMVLPDVSPAAGKFLVTLFRELRSKSSQSENQVKTTTSWQRWIKSGLSKYPQALENVKNYLFQPLFKLDRPGSLDFLQDLIAQTPTWTSNHQETDFHALLQLAAIDTGKKAGLVEEPNPLGSQKSPKKTAATIPLDEEKIGFLLSHASDTVRSLAFSVIVSSSSSVRAFSPIALDILGSHMDVLYSDTDAKFRNETLSSTKHMIERLRGATAVMTREIENLSFNPSPNTKRATAQIAPEKIGALLRDAEDLLRRHEGFIEWYLDFLMGELIPTASYQRHITTMKAIEIFLRSGILKNDPKSAQPKIPVHATTWPYSLDFFQTRPTKLLTDLLMDPFEDVRSSAASILQLAIPSDFCLQQSENSLVRYDSRLSLERIQKKAMPQGTSNVNITTSVPKQGASLDLLSNFLELAKGALTKTGRADYADGVAQCYKLLYVLQDSPDLRTQLIDQLITDLEGKVAIAATNMGEAVLKAPIHGTFAALCAVWNVVDLFEDFGTKCDPNGKKIWDDFQTRTADLSSQIWSIVKPILCNDSPEGYFPDDIEDGDIIDTKDVLSYSWRAIHESSNLMRTLVSKTNLIWSDGSKVLSSITFAQIGDLTFAQLSALRHRGAFSTVSLTFAKCCQLAQLHLSALNSEQALLRKWYQGSLQCIFTQASTTRRSAGIPALITGIMSANSKDPKPDEMILELIKIASRPVVKGAEDVTELPQVHALNSIKEIIKGNVTGKWAEQHLAQCLKAAASSLDNQVWAIHNCGLLLFRSIIDYLLGTNTGKETIESGWDGRSLKIAYESYPELPELLINILETDTKSPDEHDSGKVESVFPVLDLLRRAGPPQNQSDKIKALILRHVGSRVWSIRDMAVQTIATLIPKDQWATELEGILTSDQGLQYIDTNHRYGMLAAVNHVLERRLKYDAVNAIDSLEIVAPILDAQRQLDFELSIFTAAMHTKILCSIAELLLSPSAVENADISQKIKSILFGPQTEIDLEGLMGDPHFRNSPGGALWRRSTIRLAVLTSALKIDPAKTGRALELAIDHSPDLAVTAVKCIGRVIPLETQAEILPCLVQTCIVARERKMFDVQYQLYICISNMLGHFCSSDLQLSLLAAVKPLALPSSYGGQPPGLQAEQLRMMTWAVLHGFKSGEAKNIDIVLKNWAVLLSLNSDSDRDFDDRNAVALSLHSFFANSFFGEIPKIESLIPSLLVLYDIMNDDDSEIRDVGAATVSHLFQTSCVPLKAQGYLIRWLLDNFEHTELLKFNILCRATGTTDNQYLRLASKGKLIVDNERVSFTPASEQFRQATGETDELFAVESQNLYEDQVKELNVWCRAWNAISQQPLSSSPSIALFASWIAGALQSLLERVKSEKPSWLLRDAELVIYSRVLICTNSLLVYHQKYQQGITAVDAQLDDIHISYSNSLKVILTTIETIVKELRSSAIFPLLVEELLGPDKLELNSLASLLPALQI